MTTNKSNVQRYADMGLETICPINNMRKSEYGDYVLYEDYAALQAECEKLRKDAERYRYIKKGNQWIVAATQTGAHIDGEVLDELIDSEMEQQK